MQCSSYVASSSFYDQGQASHLKGNVAIMQLYWPVCYDLSYRAADSIDTLESRSVTGLMMIPT